MKASQFRKKDSCNKRTGIEATSKATRALDEAVIIKDFCKDIVGNPEYRLPTRKDLEKEIAESYSDEVIDKIAETQAGYVHALSGQIWRFGRSWKEAAKSNDVVILPEEPIVLDLSDLVRTEFVDDDEIEVKFDAIVYEPNAGRLEGIVFKRGIPKIGQTERSYHNVRNDIEIHLMSLALRKFAAEHPKEIGLSSGCIIPEVQASFYYMKKSSDTTLVTTTYLDDYFDNPPMRSLLIQNWKIPTGSAESSLLVKKKGAEQTVDNILFLLLDKFAGGYNKEDMKENEDCENCPDHAICYYTLAPKPIEQEETAKVRKKVEPTEEQKAIINARKGIYICNAVPGSGKTETAIKARTVSIILSELEEVEKEYKEGKDISEYLTPMNVFSTKDSRKAGVE